MQLFGGIEAGGTKFVCAVGNAAGEIIERIRIPTTIPEETIPNVIEYFKQVHSRTPLAAIGISSFGPVDLDRRSPTYGYITTAPKPGWKEFNFVGRIKEVFDIPIGFDTDVNGAAVGEVRWGNGQGLDSVLYWTVGTGVGAGGILSGKIMHGLIHPEMGHIYIPHNREHDPFDGCCPYHGDCLEGLASGFAIQQRWNVESAMDLPGDHPAWELEAEYLAYAMTSCVVSISPKRIIVGGGVAKTEGLLPKVRQKTIALLNGYIQHETILNDIDNYIVPPGLGDNAGVLGAIALAQQATQE